LAGRLLHGVAARKCAVATLAASFAIRELAAGWADLTGGAAGMSLPGGASSDRLIYFLMLALVLLAVAFRRSHPAGLTAYALSGFVTGLVGGAYASWIGFVDPGTMFNGGVTVEVVLMAVLGGVAAPAGPLVGAFIVTLLSE